MSAGHAGGMRLALISFVLISTVSLAAAAGQSAQEMVTQISNAAAKFKVALRGLADA